MRPPPPRPDVVASHLADRSQPRRSRGRAGRRPAQRSVTAAWRPADVETSLGRGRDDGGVAGEPRAVPAEIAVPSSRVALPRPSRRTASGTVTTTCGWSPPVSGSVPPARTRRQTSTSASARRRPAGRGSGPSAAAGRGAPSGSSAARTTAAPSGSSRPRSQAPPSPSGVKDRSLRLAARSSARVRASPSRASTHSGSATASSRRPNRPSTTGSNVPACATRSRSASRRSSGSVGNSATVRAIVTACPRPSPPAAPARAVSASSPRSARPVFT